MIGSLVDQRIFEILLSKYLPVIYRHLQRINMSLQLISFAWFMTLYVNFFPNDTSLRVMDLFFYEGRQVFFKIGLALFKTREEAILRENDPNRVVLLMKEKDNIDFDKMLKVTAIILVLTYLAAWPSAL